MDGGKNSYGRSVDPPFRLHLDVFFDFLVLLTGPHCYISATGTLVMR